MSTTAIIILSAVALLIILAAMFFSYNNKEIALRKEADAQRGKIQTVRDRMFQIIREQANVSTEYREAFEKIYPEIIAGRYQNGGGLMKWVRHHLIPDIVEHHRRTTNRIHIDPEPHARHHKPARHTYRIVPRTMVCKKQGGHRLYTHYHLRHQERDGHWNRRLHLLVQALTSTPAWHDSRSVFSASYSLPGTPFSIRLQW